MSDFWKTWLDIWCLAVIAFGGILAGAAFDGFEAGVKLMLTLQNPISEPVFYDIERFSFGLMGAITIGWGLTLFYFSAPRTPAIWVIKCTDRPLSC